MANKKIENDGWNELCEYVKREILEYDENMLIPKLLILRLQGLKKGQFIANNKSKESALYDNNVILCAFKINKAKIVSYLHSNTKSIIDEKHKINIIFKIIEPELNDVYVRLKSIKRQEEKLENQKLENQLNEGANYIRRTKDVSSKNKKLF